MSTNRISVREIKQAQILPPAELHSSPDSGKGSTHFLHVKIVAY